MFRMYGKAWAAVITAAVVAAYQALSGDQHVDPTEWVSIAIAAMTVVGVVVVPLSPAAKWAKTAVGVLLAVLQLLTTVILGGLQPDEILLLLITAAGAGGIWIAPATTATGDPAGGSVTVPVGWGVDR
ncbi:MAG: hypothetical protein ABW000_07325 [Actinoplanes sp.]